jgi:flagellar biosynthesis protein
MAKMKKAVALGYNKEKDNAPRVLATGKGAVAENIIDAAKKYNVPIKEDSDLVEILSKVDINQEIPPNLYKAVAEIFSFLYRATKK